MAAVDQAGVHPARAEVIGDLQQVLGGIHDVVRDPEGAAKTFVAPPGRQVTGVSDPASPFATSFTVPSPPNATTMS